jgi:invasion protein IalB
MRMQQSTTHRSRTGAAIATVIGACIAFAPFDAAAQTLPGGASQLQETHGDWRVTCAQQDSQRVCTLSQQQTDKDSRQLVLGIELKVTAGDRVDGTMVLPFGLAIDKPVTAQIDDAGASQTLRFRTCVPIGCLVPIGFDANTLAALRKGTLLTVKAAAADGAQDAAFRISLKGFASALDRTAALAK